MAPPLVKKAAPASPYVQTDMAQRIKDALRLVEDSMGYGNRQRLERAADEGANLGYYTPRALQEALSPNLNHLLTVMDPARFQDFAARLPDRALREVPYFNAGEFMPNRAIHKKRDLGEVLATYGDIARESGWRDVPQLRIDLADKRPLLFTNTGALTPTAEEYPFVRSHEGRHRSMALADYLREPKSLVVVRPQFPGPDGDLKWVGDTDAARTEFFKNRLQGRRIVPEEQRYVPLTDRNLTEETLPKFDPLFAEGGEVRMDKGGWLRRVAVPFEKNIADWFGTPSRDAARQVMEETRKSGEEAGRFGTPNWLSPELEGTPSSVRMARLRRPGSGAFDPQPSDFSDNSGYERFRSESVLSNLPGFQIHTHPPLDPTGKDYPTNANRRGALKRDETGALAPSLGDIGNWLDYSISGPNKGPDIVSYIHGAQPDALVAYGRPDFNEGLLPGIRGVTSSDLKDVMTKHFKSDMTPAYKAVTGQAGQDILRDYNVKNPMSLWGLILSDNHARRGVPVTFDKDMRFGAGYAEDALNDLYKRLAKTGEEFAEGGKVEGYETGGKVGALRRLIKAYHGSPHDFDKFDYGKIGTGEGVQAFGHGLYFADSPDVANVYRTSLSEPKFTFEGKTVSGTPYKNWDYALRMNGGNIGKLRAELGPDNQALLDDLVSRGYGLAPSGHMYEVGIDADPTRILGWDKPLTDQLSLVEQIKHPVIDLMARKNFQSAMPGRAYTGQSLYSALGDAARNFGPAKSQEQVSDLLNDSGVQGIKYLDQFSRGADTGTSNYVTFRDTPVNILRKYERGGHLTMAGGGDVADKMAKGMLRMLRGKKRDEAVEAAVREAETLAKDKFLDPVPNIQTVTDPVRLAYPGIYKSPRVIAEEARDAIIPEGESLQRLFGVGRGDLDAIAQGRDYGALSAPDPAFPFPARSRGAAVSPGVLTPRNAQRISDITEESSKFDPLRFTRSWYEMQPLWDRAAELGLSPEEMQRMNARIGLHSALADPRSEINRGTLANKLINEGRLDDYVQFGGVPAEGRLDKKSGKYFPGRAEVEGFPADMMEMKSHLAHKGHVGKLLELEDKGFYVPSTPKVATYIQATDPTFPDPRRPIADSHFARGLGYADVHANASPGVELSGPEYKDLLPWWEKVSKGVGEHPRDLQALLWNVMGPQTGVRYIGPPKLEIMADEIMKASRRLGVSPETARDMVITGKAAAYKDGGLVGDNDPPYFDYQTPQTDADTIGPEGRGILSQGPNILASNNVDAFGDQPMSERLAQTRAVEDDAHRLMESAPKPPPMQPMQQQQKQSDPMGDILKIGLQVLPLFLQEGGPVPGYDDGGSVPTYDPEFWDRYGNAMPQDEEFGGRFTRTPAERRVVRERAIADRQPYLDEITRSAGDFWRDELANLRKVDYHPAKYGAGVLHRLGSAISPEGPSIQDIVEFASPDMRFRDEYGPVAAPLDVLGIVGSALTGGGALGRLTKKTMSEAMPMMRRMLAPTAAPVVAEGAREMAGYAEGGEVEHDPYENEMAWGGVPGESMYARGGSVDDDMLLYHAIDTQNFSKGGALRYCGGGYAR